MKTIDDIRDIAIRVTDKLVDEGIVRSCIDTEDDTEFSVQDIIFDEIIREIVFDLYLKDKFTYHDNEIIDEAIENGVIDTDDILDDFIGYLEDNDLDWDMDFAEHYQNGLTHKQNLKYYEEFK